MSDRQEPASQPAAVAGRDGVRERLDRLVARARLALTWEQVWPRLWWPLGCVIAFLTLSWLGLWLDLPPTFRMAGVGLFGLAFLASLLPLLRLKAPGRQAALSRLDRDAGLAHGPARALEDTLALGGEDSGSRALWELHRRRNEAAVGRLRVAPPRPDMPRRDPRALRAAGLVAMVASGFFAGPEVGARLAAAFQWREPSPAAPAFRVDGWIDPPIYTRTPPLMIDLASGTGEQRLRAPVKSTVVIRIAGQGDAIVTPAGGLASLPAPENARPDLREQRFTLQGDADLSVRTGLTGSMRLRVEAIPDRAPEISFAAPPEPNVRGTFNLTYRAKDDYGLASAEGLVEKAQGRPGRRTLVPPPTIALSLPSDPQSGADVQSTVDLTAHAWAGAKVRLTLVAKDEAEQEGRSDAMEFTLPQRPFSKPLARALVEQRRNLVLDPDDRGRVQTALDALLIEPETYTPQWGVFLGLRAASARVRDARTDPDLVEVADLLWSMAVQIEDGDLSGSERDLRAAQERLREALERNAGDDEVKKLTEELRQAMDRFLREFAERMQRDRQQAQDQNQAPSRTVTPDDLNRMLGEIEDSMKRGDVAEAQRLLDELRNILENLQTARPGNRTTDPLAREMNRSMEDLDAMAREQQGLRDETFRQGQDRRGQRGDRRQDSRPRQGQQGQQGQQGRRQPGQQGQQGEEQAENGQDGQEGQQGRQGLSRRQQALRERLQDLQRRMQGLGMQNEQGLGDAEQAMREAEEALGQGQDGQAVDAQGRAVEGLQRGGQGMAQQMQQMMGQGEGNGEPGGQPGQGEPRGRSQTGQRDDDPLGRPTRSRDFSDGRVRVPTADESATARARRIMEELRRKLGDPARPREELDYFDRLLRPR